MEEIKKLRDILRSKLLRKRHFQEAFDSDENESDSDLSQSGKGVITRRQAKLNENQSNKEIITPNRSSSPKASTSGTSGYTLRPKNRKDKERFLRREKKLEQRNKNKSSEQNIESPQAENNSNAQNIGSPEGEIIPPQNDNLYQNSTKVFDNDQLEVFIRKTHFQRQKVKY